MRLRVSSRRRQDVRGAAIGLVQMRCDRSREENLDRAEALVRQAADKGARVVCLPELFLGPYFCCEERSEPLAFAESIPGPTTDRLAGLAKEQCITLIGGSIFEKDGENRYNTAVVFGSDGSILGTYRKSHIPYDDLYFEAHYFRPGDQGFPIFATSELTFGVLICYDQWFPEAARAMALQGAQVIFYPTAIGTIRGEPQVEGDWHDAWETVQRGHAISNGVYVAAANRIGREGKLQFWGQSFLCDPFGTVVKRGSAKREEVVLATIDPERSAFVQREWGFLEKRRPEIYGEITKRQT